MDPTTSLIAIPRPFEELPELPQLPQPYTRKEDSEAKLSALVIDITKGTTPVPSNVKVELYNMLLEAKNLYSKIDAKTFRRSVAIANPYESINRSIFMNRAAMKLANICAVYQLLDGQITTCSDLAGGPGGFVQFLQYKLPQARIWGITLTSNNPLLNWKGDKLDLTRFTASTGEDGTGDLYTNWKSYIKEIKADNPSGVDLTTADGGIDVSTANNFNRQELLSSRLITIEMCIAVETTKAGGNAVIKIFDTVSQYMADLIYTVSQCFDETSIFKPITSRPANQEKYLILKARLSDNFITHWRRTLRMVTGAFGDTKYLSQIYEELPSDYVEWITKENNDSITRQIYAALDILRLNKLVEGNFNRQPLDTFKVNAIWGVPGKPDPEVQ